MARCSQCGAVMEALATVCLHCEYDFPDVDDERVERRSTWRELLRMEVLPKPWDCFLAPIAGLIIAVGMACLHDLQTGLSMGLFACMFSVWTLPLAVVLRIVTTVVPAVRGYTLILGSCLLPYIIYLIPTMMMG